MPIWATAGNHEYYSKHHGKEFYDVFCSTTYAREWSQHGLKLVRQPGMYWELNDPTRTVRLVVIGLDSGKTGNLDGRTGWFNKINPFMRSKRRDDAQYEWLERRLTVADHRDQHVILLYHIPALVSQKHVKKIRLGELHRILLRHKSVRAVVCGHIHNHQEYAASTFEAYAAQRHGAGRATQHTPPHYVVSGNGGATLDGTVFRKREYLTKDVFPDPKRWAAYSNAMQDLTDRVGFDRSLFARTIGRFKASARKDADAAKFLSFLLVEVDGQTTSVSLVSMNDLQDLFRRQPDGAPVHVASKIPPLDPDAMTSHTKHLFDL
jgi:hypothetical protein